MRDGIAARETVMLMPVALDSNMNFQAYSRRRLLRQAALAASLATVGGALPAFNSRAEASASARRLPSGHLNVRDFGAVGNGKTDDTVAFGAAMKAAASTGGNTVFIPPGNYLIQDTLDVPENVVLEGTSCAPTARTQNRGSTLQRLPGLRPNSVLGDHV